MRNSKSFLIVLLVTQKTGFMTILLAFSFTCDCGLGTYTKKDKDKMY